MKMFCTPKSDQQDDQESTQNDKMKTDHNVLVTFDTPSIPDELWILIFSFLQTNRQSFQFVSEVCKHWRHLITNNNGLLNQLPRTMFKSEGIKFLTRGSSSQLLAILTKNGKAVSVLDWRTGSIKSQFDFTFEEVPELQRSSFTYNFINLSPDSSYLVAANRLFGAWSIYNVSEKKYIKGTYNKKNPMPSPPAFLNNNQIVVLNNGGKTFNFYTSSDVGNVITHNVQLPFNQGYSSLIGSPDGQYFCCTQISSIDVFSNEGNKIRTVGESNSKIHGVWFSNKQHCIIVAYQETAGFHVKEINISTASEKFLISIDRNKATRIANVALSPDNKYLAVKEVNSSTIELWTLENKEEKQSFCTIETGTTIPAVLFGSNNRVITANSNHITAYSFPPYDKEAQLKEKQDKLLLVIKEKGFKSVLEKNQQDQIQLLDEEFLEKIAAQPNYPFVIPISTRLLGFLTDLHSREKSNYFDFLDTKKLASFRKGELTLNINEDSLRDILHKTDPKYRLVYLRNFSPDALNQFLVLNPEWQERGTFKRLLDTDQIKSYSAFLDYLDNMDTTDNRLFPS